MEFEAALPVEEIGAMIKIVREGTAMSQKGQLMQLAGESLGQLGALVSKWEGDTVQVFASMPHEEVSAEPADIEATLKELQDGMPAEGAYAMGPILQALVAKLIQQIIKLLLENVK